MFCMDNLQELNNSTVAYPHISSSHFHLPPNWADNTYLEIDAPATHGSLHIVTHSRDTTVRLQLWA